MICGLRESPIMLMGMIARGHVNEIYAQIPISCGLMIPILQLGHCCGFFELWRKLKLASLKCCLSTLPKMHFLHVFCKENLIV
jgi:hypothetical protein